MGNAKVAFLIAMALGLGSSVAACTPVTPAPEVPTSGPTQVSVPTPTGHLEPSTTEAMSPTELLGGAVPKLLGEPLDVNGLELVVVSWARSPVMPAPEGEAEGIHLEPAILVQFQYRGDNPFLRIGPLSVVDSAGATSEETSFGIAPFLDAQGRRLASGPAIFFAGVTGSESLTLLVPVENGPVYAVALGMPSENPTESSPVFRNLILWWISESLGYPPDYSERRWHENPPSAVFADPTASVALVATVEALDLRGDGPVVQLTPTPTALPFEWDDPGVDEQIRSLAEAHYDWLTFPDGPPSSTTFESTHPYPIQDGAVPVATYERDGICDLAGMREALERQEVGGWYVRLRNWRIYEWEPIEASGFEGIIPKDKVQGDVDVIDRETGQVRGTFTLFEPSLGFRFSLHYDNDLRWMLRDSPLCRLTEKAASRGGR